MKLDKVLFVYGISTFLGIHSIQAASIPVPNFSFESPQTEFGTVIDSWQDLGGESPATGLFLDSNPYLNRDGVQAAYLLAIPGVAMFQVLNTPGAVFEAGMSYDFTVSVFGKMMPEGATLSLSLFYLNDEQSMVTVGAPTTVVFSINTFVNAAPYNLIDYTASSGILEEGHGAIGRNIGIMIGSATGDGNGYWDLDNARLEAVPEPGTWALMALGLGGLFAARRLRH